MIRTLTLLSLILLLLGCADLDAERRSAAYHNYLLTLTPEQRAVEAQRAHERQLAAIQAYGLALQARPQFFPTATTHPTWIQPPQPTTCRSYMMGSTLNTTCQ